MGVKYSKMPVIDHSEQPMPKTDGKVAARDMVSAEHGARALSISEIVVQPGYEGRLHAHDADQALMVVEGSIQFIVGGETRTVRSGYTMLAPPGVPHRLVNNTWVAARMLAIQSANEVETNYMD